MSALSSHFDKTQQKKKTAFLFLYFISHPLLQRHVFQKEHSRKKTCACLVPGCRFKQLFCVQGEDDVPPRPPLPQIYSQDENPPAVPPLPRETTVIRHTSVRGLKRQSDERKRDREIGQYGNGESKVKRGWNARACSQHRHHNTPSPLCLSISGRTQALPERPGARGSWRWIQPYQRGRVWSWRLPDTT